ncbi:MAG TPA: hypothetical protein VIX86_07825 [Streptosporangiaceae bacterium]
MPAADEARDVQLPAAGEARDVQSPAADEARAVLSALRLGWCLAEARGRNRPGGPPAGDIPMPDHHDHALPLRIERSPAELRIEAQTVVAELAKRLGVDGAGDGTSFGSALDKAARNLAQIRAREASALERALPTGPAAAAQAGIVAIEAGQQAISQAAEASWAVLAELIWRFDTHIQDRLTAASESQAIGYQFGRGLSETYWALDPTRDTGSQGWSFLLGGPRCAELSRLAGRMGVYLGEYVAPAVAGSVGIWQDVAVTPAWRGDVHEAAEALYHQIRRWYELIVLGQDPTTLISPSAFMTNIPTLRRAVRLFWPQLMATVIGLGFLATLLVLLGIGNTSSWAKTVSGIVAAAGLSLATLTGTLKNSAQAMLKRLRQDAYTDLVVMAVQTAPAPPKRSDLRKAISRRELTQATPN